MKTPRIAQNFRGRTAVIFTDEERLFERLGTTLGRLGVQAELRPVQMSEGLVLPEGLDPDQHIALIDGDLTLPPSWPGALSEDEAIAPCPTIGLVGSEAPSRLRALLQLGAQSFLSKPVHSGSVYSALYLAVNAFNRADMLHAGLRDLADRRRKRIHVIRAVSALMRRRGLSEDAAYEVLRKDSMRARVSIEDHCMTLMKTLSDGDPDHSATNKRCRAR